MPKLTKNHIPATPQRYVKNVPKVFFTKQPISRKSRTAPTEKVFNIIKEQRGKKFDPVVTDAFLNIRTEIDAIAKANAD